MENLLFFFIAAATSWLPLSLARKNLCSFFIAAAATFGIFTNYSITKHVHPNVAFLQLP